MLFHSIRALQEGSEEDLAAGEMAQKIKFLMYKEEDVGLSLSIYIQRQEWQFLLTI